MQAKHAGGVRSVMVVTMLAASISACGDAPEEASAPYGDWSAEDGPIAAAVVHPERPAADRARDAERKPIEVLRFFSIAAGQTVFEFYAGSGWYSEILARALGPQGELVLHNNPMFAEYFEESFNDRDMLGRFETASYMPVAPDELDLAPASLDRALIILSYHDLLYPPAEGAAVPDRGRLLRDVYEGLKPGGLLGVVDHAGPPDVPPYEAGERLHRLNPDVLRYEAERAGFVFDGASQALAHPSDDRNTPIFEVERGATDRFVYRFRKPDYPENQRVR